MRDMARRHGVAPVVTPGGASTVPSAGTATGSEVHVVREGRMIRLPFGARGGRVVPLIRLQMGIALVVINLADVILTKTILANGGVESNPLMSGIISGTAAPMALKLMVPLLATALFICCSPTSRMADRAVATVLGVYFAITMWNLAVLGQLVL